MKNKVGAFAEILIVYGVTRLLGQAVRATGLWTPNSGSSAGRTPAG